MVECTKRPNSLPVAHHQVTRWLNVTPNWSLRGRIKDNLDMGLRDRLIAFKPSDGALRKHGVSNRHGQLTGRFEMNHFHNVVFLD